MRLTLTAILALVICSLVSLAFSPYEEYIATHKMKYAALIAAAEKGKEAELDKALSALFEKKHIKALKKNDITNLSVHKKILTNKQTWYMIYFDYEGKNYLDAAKDFEQAAPDLKKFVKPHPRARKYGTSWLQMEWICYIRGVMDKKLPSEQKIAMVTRIKPEKEQLYRSLHQGIWPGVTDQMARANNRNFSIFLVEIGEEIYEFFYFEYVGKDIEADGKASAEDACNIRWWKNTDSCQDPLPDAKGSVWSGMDPVEKKDK